MLCAWRVRVCCCPPPAPAPSPFAHHVGPLPLLPGTDKQAILLDIILILPGLLESVFRPPMGGPGLQVYITVGAGLGSFLWMGRPLLRNKGVQTENHRVQNREAAPRAAPHNHHPTPNRLMLPTPSLLLLQLYNTLFLFLFACVAYGVGSCLTGQTARLPLVGACESACRRSCCHMQHDALLAGTCFSGPIAVASRPRTIGAISLFPCPCPCSRRGGCSGAVIAPLGGAWPQRRSCWRRALPRSVLAAVPDPVGPWFDPYCLIWLCLSDPAIPSVRAYSL